MLVEYLIRSGIMKKYIVIAAVMALYFSSWAGGGWKITFFSGDVVYRPLSGGEWKKCAGGDVLDEATMIRTGTQSTVVLEKGGRKITVTPEITVSLKALASSADPKSVLDLSGSALHVLKNLFREKRVSRTETLGVRGDDAGGNSGPPWSDDLDDTAKPDASPVLVRARNDFDSGRYADVAAALKDEEPGLSGAESETRSCLLGMSYFHLGYYAESVPHLERAASSPSLDGEFRTRCCFLRALSGIYLGDHDESIRRLESLAEKNPESPFAPRACFILAGIYRLKGSNETARYWYRELIKRYPKSSLVPEAETKMSSITGP